MEHLQHDDSAERAPSTQGLEESSPAVNPRTSHDTDPRTHRDRADRDRQSSRAPEPTLLVMGSIIGVGICSAVHGSISLFALAFATLGVIRLALMFAVISRRLPVQDGGIGSERSQTAPPRLRAASQTPCPSFRYLLLSCSTMSANDRDLSLWILPTTGRWRAHRLRRIRTHLNLFVYAHP